MPKKIDVTNQFEANKLSIVIDITKPSNFLDQYLGYSMYVANTTNDSIKFTAQDSRLNIKLQAKNNRGKWQDIEYIPRSTCGNSYHTLNLEPNTYWSFSIPQYEGAIKTKMRAVLIYYNGKKSKKIYSNEIVTGINPGQFFNRLNYTPNGIMDPYNE